MGDKITSKKIAQEAGVSTVPGYMGLIEDADEAVKISNEIGYPVMIKASAGGGGKGMRIAWNDDEAREGFQSSKNEAKSSFGDDRIFIEKFVTQPRHIEIQVLADKHGNCDLSGRARMLDPAPQPEGHRRGALAVPRRGHPQGDGRAGRRAGKAVGYAQRGHGGVHRRRRQELLFPRDEHALQVEHPVTELITGVDLVEQMIRVAAGEKLRSRRTT
jgi:propionyl-CoA carboxylase alpha chain